MSLTERLLKRSEPYIKVVELWLHRHGHWFGAIAFGLTLLFGCLWFIQARHIDQVTSAMLTHEREPIPNKFPSLNDLILSKADLLSPARSSTPSPQAAALANQLKDKLQAQGRPVDDVEILNSIALHTVSSNSGDNRPTITKQYLYDENNDAALFIPAFTLLNSPEMQKGLDQVNIKNAIRADRQLLLDLEASSIVASYLPEFKGLAEFDNTDDVVAQAYFITETGVTRIWQSNATAKITRDNFNPHRVFQDRPYFWPSLESDQADFSHFSYTSKPYFDVAGNGIVITGCWAFRSVGTYSDGVLCLDSLKTVSLRELLDDYIVGEPGSFTCSNLDNGNHACDFTHLTKQQKSIQSHLQILTADLDRNRRFDDLQGGLYVLAHEAGGFESWLRRQTFTGSSFLRFIFSSDDDSTIYFSVPVSKPEEEKESRVTPFNIFEVNLGRPHRHLVIFALFTFVFGTTAAVCFYVLHRSRIHAVQFMREVENVMVLSPVAFCYLDECDHITTFNQAFCDLVGCEKSELRERTLRSFLATGDSLTRYDIVSKYREKMQFTPPYEVQLERVDKSKIQVVISGSALYVQPRPRHGRFNQKPHTFGIILKPTETRIRDYVPFETKDFELALQHWRDPETARAIAT